MFIKNPINFASLLSFRPSILGWLSWLGKTVEDFIIKSDFFLKRYVKSLNTHLKFKYDVQDAVENLVLKV